MIILIFKEIAIITVALFFAQTKLLEYICVCACVTVMDGILIIGVLLFISLQPSRPQRRDRGVRSRSPSENSSNDSSSSSLSSDSSSEDSSTDSSDSSVSSTSSSSSEDDGRRRKQVKKRQQEKRQEKRQEKETTQ